jgi:hypothetical protein
MFFEEKRCDEKTTEYEKDINAEKPARNKLVEPRPRSGVLITEEHRYVRGNNSQNRQSPNAVQ